MTKFPKLIHYSIFVLGTLWVSGCGSSGIKYYFEENYSTLNELVTYLDENQITYGYQSAVKGKNIEIPAKILMLSDTELGYRRVNISDLSYDQQELLLNVEQFLQQLNIDRIIYTAGGDYIFSLDNFRHWEVFYSSSMTKNTENMQGYQHLSGSRYGKYISDTGF